MIHAQAVTAMTDLVATFINYVSKHLPDDIFRKLTELRTSEESHLAKVV